MIDQLKYFPRDTHDDSPDALEMALREAKLNEISFIGLEEKKDPHGRTIEDPDYGLTSPAEDTKDEDDEEENRGNMGWVNLFS
ncbi:MAG: hypothetical protein WC330_06395 [Candidatus Omnitrophota bacterium]